MLEHNVDDEAARNRSHLPFAIFQREAKPSRKLNICQKLTHLSILSQFLAFFFKLDYFILIYNVPSQ